jgi:hypothetical protein
MEQVVTILFYNSLIVGWLVLKQHKSFLDNYREDACCFFLIKKAAKAAFNNNISDY